MRSITAANQTVKSGFKPHGSKSGSDKPYVLLSTRHKARNGGKIWLNH